MQITDDLIRKAASAIIKEKLAKSNIYPKDGTEPLDEIPESVREEVMDSAEAVLQVVRDHLAGCPV